MPDFNFVQKKPDKTDPDQHPQGKASAHLSEGHSVTNLPEELTELPKEIHGGKSASVQMETEEMPLTTADEPERVVPSIEADSKAGLELNPPQFDEPDKLSVEEPKVVRPPKASPEKSKWPLVGFSIIIGILLLMSFIWYVNPYPPLRQAIAEFLRTAPPDERVRARAQREQAAKVETPSVEIAAPQPEAVREFDFYIQVSSWKEHGQAQRHADELKKRSLPVVVESEYLSLRQATFYRVRLGPFESSTHALVMKDSLKDVIDKGAFIDSVRINTVDIPMEVESQQRPNVGSSGIQPSPVRVIPVPSTGYAVQVSSFRSKRTAVDEAARLLKEGIPAIVTFDVARGSWYRIMVGPFETRNEAQEYARVITVTYGNEVLIVRFGKEKNQSP